MPPASGRSKSSAAPAPAGQAFRPPAKLGFFALRFAVLYALLIVPWPGLHQAVGAYAQSFGNLLFGRTGQQLVMFRAKGPADKSYSAATDTLMVLYNKDIAVKGKKAGWSIGLETKQSFWLPFSFYLALVGATSMSWPRRAWALFLGLLAAHAILALILTLNFVRYASTISMFALSPFWQSVVIRISILLEVVSGPSILVYLFIWPLASFRREDLARLIPGWLDPAPKTAAEPAPIRQSWRAQLKAARKLRPLSR